MRDDSANGALTLRSFRTLALAVMAGPVVAGVALFFIATGHRPGASWHPPGAWLYAVIVAVGLAGAFGAQTFGYRVPPLSPTSDPEESRGAALRAYQQSMIRRFTFSQAVAVVGLALTIGTHSTSILPYVLAATIAEGLMAYHIWPSGSLIERVRQRLDRNGGRSQLAEALRGSL